MSLTREEVVKAVRSSVELVEVIDLHTHLFPRSHGDLMLWGIDALLTYHYLTSEYFTTAPADVKEEDFFKLSTRDQATKVWQALFIDRSPLSEGCKVLKELGLEKELAARDLAAIRAYFDSVTDKDAHLERVFRLAKVRYAIMTNNPFAPEEVVHLRPELKPFTHRLRTALRLDPLMLGRWDIVEAAIKKAGFEGNMEGAKQFVRSWIETLKPEYLMASTPKDFEYPSAKSELLEKVLMPLAEEFNLALALKVGAERGMNPKLGNGGDGVSVSDVGIIKRLCQNFPKVKFLVTFLSRVNQHELTVVAQKFRNLHLYGCWWYCNNPSIIKEMTHQRIELLGTAFTAQHSDARVLEQLIYKWKHSKLIIAEALVEHYLALFDSGWTVTAAEIDRDVKRLLGGSYEEFLQK